MSVALDRIDLSILSELQEDSSLTNLELAARVNLSPSPCLVRVRNLERLGVISRRVAVLDASLLGLGVMAIVEIGLERQGMHARESFADTVRGITEVMDCFMMTGQTDYLLRVVARDLVELEHIITHKLTSLPGVASVRSNVVLKRLANKTTLPIDTTRPIQIHGLAQVS
ncbi:Bkd operon transcriptional regulator [Paraburkholderia unamae]|uniref:Lrp/AsnC family transcriptional regulator n=1 Tax=Paraburkholderia unamae TaxID=219649 RepID=UPI001CAAAE1A|nr:Lrp/AsnC family transcriptional regulator [Paraburkholderia unamae]CAG9263849.1 Bkd operon transcriptional regulator [Paraburkholderia unamae]